MPASLSFREGKAGKFFEDSNPFLPHIVKGKKAPELNFSYTKKQGEIRKRLYGGVLMKENIYKKFGGKYKTVQVDKMESAPNYSDKAFKDYKKWPSYISMARQRETMQRFTDEEYS